MALSIIQSIHDSNLWAAGLWAGWEPNAFDGLDAKFEACAKEIMQLVAEINMAAEQ